MSAIPNIAIVWAQYGPYHFARMSALRALAGESHVHAVEVASRTSVYAWDRVRDTEKLVTLCPGLVFETVAFGTVFMAARRVFQELNIDICLLPGYAPSQSLAVLVAAKSLGLRTVMMNEGHAGTSRAGRIGTMAKRRLMGLFDSALVGGQPQKRYVTSFGVPERAIFTGYDAVDNDYFSTRAEEVRSRAGEFRARFDLPEHYFLSLGRFVGKKNLATLIRAYHLTLNTNPRSRTHLVMVGSGEEEAALRKLCGELGLRVYDKTQRGVKADGRPDASDAPPGVHFYGFRQIEDNPVFYALADVFILPSLWEEWGLVVNEAMACGLPVVVSEMVGSAEDLLPARPLTGAISTSESQRQGLASMAGRTRQNGFVFDPHSAESLANALTLLEGSAELRRKMGAASRVIVEQFSCENFAHNALAAVWAAGGSAPQLEQLGKPSPLASQVNP